MIDVLEYLISEIECWNRKCGNGSHVGKYSTCLDEVLDACDPDDTTGNTDWYHHVALHVFPETMVAVLEGRYVMIPFGAYLVYTGTSGQVWVTGHSESVARQQFATIQAEYDKYTEGEDL